MAFPQNFVDIILCTVLEVLRLTLYRCFDAFVSFGRSPQQNLLSQSPQYWWYKRLFFGMCHGWWIVEAASGATPVLHSTLHPAFDSLDLFLLFIG
jgi:hypothetical protein